MILKYEKASKGLYNKLDAKPLKKQLQWEDLWKESTKGKISWYNLSENWYKIFYKQYVTPSITAKNT